MYKVLAQLIDLATRQLGYHETGKNHTKYSQWFDTTAWQWFNTKKQGAEWCAIFICWLFCQAEIIGKDFARTFLGCPSPKNNCAAGCGFFYDYLKAKGYKSSISKVKVGDIIFFKNSKGECVHVGFCVEVNGNNIYTIEGNKDNQVKKCLHYKTSDIYYGVIAPDYVEAQKLYDKYHNIAEQTPVSTPTPAPAPSKPETPAPVQKTKRYQVICKKGLNVRTGPGKKYTDVGNLDYGQTVTVYETSNDWAKIDKTKARWACIKQGSSVYMKVI